MVTKKNMLSYAKSYGNQKCMVTKNACFPKPSKMVTKKTWFPTPSQMVTKNARFQTPSQIVTQHYLVLSANCNLTDITCLPTKLSFFVSAGFAGLFGSLFGFHWKKGSLVGRHVMSVRSQLALCYSWRCVTQNEIVLCYQLTWSRNACFFSLPFDLA